MELKTVYHQANELKKLNGFNSENNELHLSVFSNYSFKAKISILEKEAIYSEFSLLLSSGIDLKTSFEIIISGITKKGTKILMENIFESFKSGKSLSESIKFQGGHFSEFEAVSMQIGEETGNLKQIFAELAEHYKKSEKQRKQLISTLSYPIIVLIMSVVTVAFMLIFIVPIFSQVFAQTGKELPAVTRLLINLSSSMPIILLVLSFLGISITVLIYYTRDTIPFRKLKSKLILKTPIIGPLIYKSQILIFIQGMKVLTSSKVNLDDALTLVQKMISFYALEMAIENTKEDVIKNGLNLHEALAKHKVFPSKIITLVKISEETNSLDIVFAKIQIQMQEELTFVQDRISKLIEPALMLFLGLVVGVILVAMYLPMFDLSTLNF